MSVGKLAGLYAISAAVFFAIDFVWLSIATPRIYKPQLGDLLAEQPKLGVAAVFYLLYVIGIIALAVIPGVREASLATALWRGALFGFLAYATYDLTNLATLRDWPAQLAALDMVWGTVLTGATSVAGYYAARWLGV
jgi:uncharacterized membrane protein